MKNIANRLIAIAASTLVLGTMAFGQTRTTATIPFDFHTTSGTLMPAGTYEFSHLSLNGVEDLMLARNAVSGESKVAGIPRFEPYLFGKTPNLTVDFSCLAKYCTLKSIKMTDGTFVYSIPRKGGKSQNDGLVSVISIPVAVKTE